MVNYIQQADYAAVCDERELSVLQENSQNRQQAEAAAIAEAVSYLKSRYDTDKIFSDKQTFEKRNPHLLLTVINIALYYLSQRLSGRLAGEKRQILYDNAIAWLSKVQKGHLTPELPMKTQEPQNFALFVNSIPRSVYHW